MTTCAISTPPASSTTSGSADRHAPDGVVLTYMVQGKPRLTDIKFEGNTKFSDSKLRKKITSKVGEPLDERKLFTDSQEIQKMYQKAGYPGTEVKYVPNIDETAGRGTATFEIKESPKIKIMRRRVRRRQAFPQKKLRKVIKTRKRWMFSWLTGSGVFKDEQFEEDKEKLREFYRDKGYIDFEIKDVQFEYPTPRHDDHPVHHLRRPAIQGRLGEVHGQPTLQQRRKSPTGHALEPAGAACQKGASSARTA